MNDMNRLVVDQALEWIRNHHTIWLCTVISTYGSSPQPPGAMMVAQANGDHMGSLSGGCVEEAFIHELINHGFIADAQIISYGESDHADRRLTLPCGATMDVLIERMSPISPDTIITLETIRTALVHHVPHQRRVELRSPCTRIIQVPFLPTRQLVIAGFSPVSRYCAQFAHALGYRVVVCDPYPPPIENIDLPEEVIFEAMLPSLFIASGVCHRDTAIVALSHDPRIDDLAMIEAIRTPAFYIGVMGSKRTSKARATRLRRSGGLTDDDIARLHMPIGLDLGSKTPSEIALAVMADILGVANGKFGQVAHLGTRSCGRKLETVRE